MISTKKSSSVSKPIQVTILSAKESKLYYFPALYSLHLRGCWVLDHWLRTFKIGNGSLEWVYHRPFFVTLLLTHNLLVTTSLCLSLLETLLGITGHFCHQLAALARKYPFDKIFCQKDLLVGSCGPIWAALDCLEYFIYKLLVRIKYQIAPWYASLFLSLACTVKNQSTFNEHITSYEYFLKFFFFYYSQLERKWESFNFDVRQT